MSYPIQTVLSSDLSEHDQRQMRELRDAVYPPRTQTTERPISADPPSIDWPDSRRERTFLLRVEGQLVAASTLIPRRIETAEGPMDVLGLADVKTHPDFRKRGYGAAVVRAALAYVDDGTFPLSLFQTDVPDFYRKLGARTVDNRFVNRLGQNPAARPWWGACVMVYPAGHRWVEGTVDLAGPAW